MILNENFKGGLLIASGMLILAIADNYVRFISEDIGLWQFHLIRSLIAVPAMILFASLRSYDFWPKNLKLVALRTAILVLAMFIYFGSLAFFPISQVAAGLFTSPIFVIIFSVLFLGESLYFSRIVAVFLGTVGISIVLGINVLDLSFLSIIPVASGAFYALASLALRHWCYNETPTSIMLIFFLGMGIFAAMMTFLIEINQFFGIFMISETFLTFPLKIPSEETFYIVIGHAAGSILGGILITAGYQKGETSFVSVFEYSFLLFATLWAYMFFAEFISSTVLFGMILIVLSGFLISLSEKKNNFSQFET